LIVSNVPAGRHPLVARKEGHEPWERVVEVAANQRNEVRIDVTPSTPAIAEPPRPARGNDAGGTPLAKVPARAEPSARPGPVTGQWEGTFTSTGSMAGGALMPLVL